MFKFEKEQKVFEIGSAKFGGQLGENPAVVIGTIFYNRHKVVTDSDYTF